MKVVILAGGFGTRISEESHLKPKPMIEIGGYPILWHIMKLYSSYGFHDFVICAGYKQHVIKDYFANYYLYSSDVTFDFSDGGRLHTHNNTSEPWSVTVVDTGLNTMTGGRIKRVAPYIKDEPFFLTYGDGVADIALDALLTHHQKRGAVATLTAVQVPQRFGVLDIGKDLSVLDFREKDDCDAGRINGGFMVLEPEVFSYIDDDTSVFEQDPLRNLASEGKLSAYIHSGFWKCMDTQRDRYQLEDMWAENRAPWKVW